MHTDPYRDIPMTKAIVSIDGNGKRASAEWMREDFTADEWEALRIALLRVQAQGFTKSQ